MFHTTGRHVCDENMAGRGRMLKVTRQWAAPGAKSVMFTITVLLYEDGNANPV